MNFLKDLFSNMNTLMLEGFQIPLTYLLSYFIFLSLIYLLHVKYLKKNLNKNIKEANELKKVHLETTYQAKKRDLFVIYVGIFIFLIIATTFKNHLNIFLPVLSGIIIILIFSLKEQLNNIFLGILFKSSLGTTIQEGMLFYFKDRFETYEIIKINIFKTIIKNKETGFLESIENNILNLANIIHKPFKGLDYVEFQYFIPAKTNLVKYQEKVEKEFLKFKTEINFNDLRKEMISVKEKFRTTPHLRPFFKIKVIPKSKIETEIRLTISVYEYDQKRYIQDYEKFRP